MVSLNVGKWEISNRMNLPRDPTSAAAHGHESVATPEVDASGAQGGISDDTIPTTQRRRALNAPATQLENRLDLCAGRIVRSRYLLEKVIGQGGSSIVFRAKDLRQSASQDKSEHFVAIKLLRTEQRADPMAILRLKREFTQMRCLAHPGVVRVFDLDCDGDIWFICMELVAGPTAKTWLEKPRGLAEALRIIITCCEALEYAHSLDILHGDLKLTNLMLARDGTAKLIDFGSAPRYGTAMAEGGVQTSAATPLYASPQVLAGKRADRLDDVYSLACLSYSILSAGRHPFGGRPSLEDGRAKSAPNHVAAIPAEIFEIIERGLSAEPERRPASVRDFLSDFTEASRRQTDLAADGATATPPTAGTKRHPATLLRGAFGVPRSSSHRLYGGMHAIAHEGAVPGKTGTGPETATSNGDFGGHPVSHRHARPFLALTAIAVAIFGASALLRLVTHRDTLHSAQLLPEASATSSEMAPATPAQADLSTPAKPVTRDSGVISFESATVHASAAQPLVAISVKRLYSTSGRAAFVWRVERGTAHPGVDYERTDPKVVRFIEGQAIRTLFIPLINPRGDSDRHGPRAFTVALEQVAGGPALGRFARVTVDIDPPPTSSGSADYQARAAP
jgi:serine/threonine protein kinase